MIKSNYRDCIYVYIYIYIYTMYIILIVRRDSELFNKLMFYKISIFYTKLNKLYYK